LGENKSKSNLLKTVTNGHAERNSGEKGEKGEMGEKTPNQRRE